MKKISKDASVLLEGLTYEGLRHPFSEKACEIRDRLTGRSLNVPLITVATATCGQGAGSLAALNRFKSLIRKEMPDAILQETGCIGLCSEEPTAGIQLPGKNRLFFRNVTEKNAEKIFRSLILKNKIPTELLIGQLPDSGKTAWKGIPFLDDHPFFRGQTVRVTKNCGIMNPFSIEEYMARGGYLAFAKALHTMTPFEVCDEIEKSGLRGRGGAGFPTGDKWKNALSHASIQRYVICNADEGDPGTYMGRNLIESDPHRILEGLAIAAYAVGADTAYIGIRARCTEALRRLEHALAEATACGLTGENILDSGFSLKIHIWKSAGGFVCGEETSLIHSLEGKRAMPYPRPPYPSEKGLYGKPTVVNNVETLANVPDIIRDGSGKFAEIGIGTSRGTKILTVSGNIRRTGVIEVSMGTTFRTVVDSICGGIPEGRKFKALMLGGPIGSFFPESQLDTRIDYESVRSAGTVMGSGGFVVLDDTNCMVDTVKYLLDFIRNESCGKCIPCREGTRHLYHILSCIARGRHAESGNDALLRFRSVIELRNLAEVIRETSLCGLGQNAPQMVLSALRWFREEFEEHVFERRCSAGICRDLETPS